MTGRQEAVDDDIVIIVIVIIIAQNLASASCIGVWGSLGFHGPSPREHVLPEL